MTLKRFLSYCLVITLAFLIGFCVGRFVMPRKIVIITVNIRDLVEIVERYNELKYELKDIWNQNEQAIIEKPESEK